MALLIRRAAHQHPLRLPPPPAPPRLPHRTLFLGTALLGLGWAADRYLYAEAVARTLRLAYNAGLTIVDYKLNFSPDRPADELHARVANRLAACCERNGGLYIKLGQAIAIQAALLPPVYTHALASIFDAASPMPFQLVRQVCSRELPGGIDRHFETFDPTPIACGSIAQVHRATLKGSATPVAVKVQRPDIPIQIELDLFAYRSLLYVYEKVFDLPVYFVAQYVSDQIRKETDFLCEARNAERTAALVASDARLREHIYVPPVHWPLTTRRVLTTELVDDGCRLTDTARLAEKRLHPKAVMDLAMQLFATMVFSFGWLHCDLHPGNLLVLAHAGKPKLALIDHGLYIHLPETFRRDYCELWRSLFVLDSASIDRIAQGWGIANSDLFASATLMRPFAARKPRAGGAGPPASAYESSLKIKATLKTMLANEALIPRELVFVVRCMRMMQGNNQVLGSPTNRLAILAHGAAAGMAINPPLGPRDAGLTTTARRWMDGTLKLWTFRAMLVLVDVGFFFTRVRQCREGFEDILQRQVQTLAREEFGLTLDDSAFVG
ncbi:hypothetical protein PtA15_18A424 [Puccinia triticina]|uniref:ABC1 atypical kinase-like domain-containing protein n=1 Tax=Puccinia triticina TaxID=208348 RepID=A0ABY7D6V0_9BASI|nr:uncharacterized protein PtA15_18A424 [Puccinia triticina]WAQ93364.1 hypothetical protein PtA15_18A424 [Puccinia triticina]